MEKLVPVARRGTGGLVEDNAADNQISPFSLGRKNGLFSGSPRGAHARALFYSDMG